MFAFQFHCHQISVAGLWFTTNPDIRRDNKPKQRRAILIATIFAHMLVPLAVRAGAGPNLVSRRLLVVAAAATAVPDLDVAAFLYGIPYGDPFGHRGFTHSFAFAGLAGLAATFFASRLNSNKLISFWTIFISMASHPVLDSLTNGGYGVAFFWPMSDARYFLPWQPIMVSPIGIRGFFEARSIQVLISEFFWVLLPLLAAIITAVSARRFRDKRKKALMHKHEHL